MKELRETSGPAADIGLDTLTIDVIRQGFADGAFTAEDLTRACLARTAEINPRLNAIIFLNENATEEARAVDRRRMAGELLGPLAGVPFVAKDTMNVAGLPTTGGWHLLSSRAGGIDLIPEKDSCVVARMRAAGAVLIGKTNVPVLSATGTHADDSWAGPTLNATDPILVPGGSSAGTAAAVASGMAVVGLAEETGGSIQNPAAAHGLVGVKPTFGLVSNAGVMPLGASTLDVMGPIARTVRDAAHVLDVLAGYSPADPKTIAGIGAKPRGGYAASLGRYRLDGKRLGLYGRGWRKESLGWRGKPLSAEIGDAYGRAQDVLKTRGVELVGDPFADSGFADLARVTEGGDEYDVRGMESLPYDLDVFLRGLGSEAAVKSFVEFAEATKAEDAFATGGVLNYLAGFEEFEACKVNPTMPPSLKSFFEVRDAYLTVFNEVMERFSLDGMVFPQMADPLPRHGTGIGIRETTVAEINIAGLPAVTVPAGRLASDEPFNLIFIGPLWSEAKLLGMADDFEEAFG
jgi:aspartyl-tRNA(Asn)/glutamyl-tRNA(Gln) amidotransferase subunit A